MRNARAALLALFLAFVALSSCSRRGREIRVGVILPLSGGGASLGKSCLDGIQLAIDETNANKAETFPQIRLVIEDDELKPAVGVSAFQRLATVDKVDAVIGPLSSGVALAVAPLAENKHVVMLSPGASTPALSAAGEYVFRNELSEEYGAKAQALLALKPLGFKRIALLYPNNEYGVGTARVFRSEYQRLGGKIVGEETFEQGATDFRTALIRIKTAKPDAIFVVFQDEIVNIVKQKVQLGVPGVVYTTAVIEDTSILHSLGELANGIIYTHYGTFENSQSAGPVGLFVKNYASRFKEPPTYYSALGYDAGGIMAQALKNAGGNTSGLKDALHGIQNFPGVTGETSFDKNGDVTKPVVLKVIRNGNALPYEP